MWLLQLAYPHSVAESPRQNFHILCLLRRSQIRAICKRALSNRYPMATVVPPPSKRQRREAVERSRIQDVAATLPPEDGSFKARFVDADGAALADVIEIPLATPEKDVSLL